MCGKPHWGDCAPNSRSARNRTNAGVIDPPRHASDADPEPVDTPERSEQPRTRDRGKVATLDGEAEVASWVYDGYLHPPPAFDKKTYQRQYMKDWRRNRKAKP
mgnify:CR=1 FL=1